MTELLSGIETPSDAELISRVRGGDTAAYGELFSRHVDAARRLGRQLVRGSDADDLVSEAFAKTLQVLQSGGGPDIAFRAYLLTSVRRLHVDRIRSAKRVQPTDDMTLYDDGLPFQDTAVESFENGAAARAFSSLPERWQLVLWHLEVEGQKPADIAPLLGMSANSVSALAYRAREGLRQAFLTMHLADCPTEECRWVNEHLGGYVRKGLSRRDTTKVEEHLEGCRRCTAMYLELDEVNSNLAGIIAPLLLGAAAAGYLSSTGAAGLTGVSAFFGRIRDSFGAHSGGTGTATTGSAAGGAASGAGAAGAAFTTGGMVAAGSVVAAGVAAVATAALVLGGGSPKEVVVEAQQPGVTATAPGDGGSVGADVEGDAGEDAGSTRQGTQDGSGVQGPSSQTSDAVVIATIEPSNAGDGTASDPGAGGGGSVTTGTDGTSSGSGQGAGNDTGSGTGSGTGNGSGSGTGKGSGKGSGNGSGTGTGSDPGSDPGTGSDPGSDGPILPPIDLPDPLPDTPPINLPVPPPAVPPVVPAPPADGSTGGNGDPGPVTTPGTGETGADGSGAGTQTGGSGAGGTGGSAQDPADGTGGSSGNGSGGSTSGGTSGTGGTVDPGTGTGGSGTDTGTGGSEPSGSTGGATGGTGDGDTGSLPGSDGSGLGEFRIVDAPVTTAVSDGKGGDRHRYTVTVSFAGVRDGDLITLSLVGDQARFCRDDDCSPHEGDDTRRVTVDLHAGTTVFVYEFDARLPGGSSASLSASLGDRTQVSDLER